MTSTRGYSAPDEYDAPNRLCRSLWVVVAVLGPISFAVSFGSPQALDYLVRLNVLAAIVASVGLLPGQSARIWIVVALAVTGFLDALDTWIRGGVSGWAVTSIVLLNLLQSIAALVALLQESRIFTSAESTGHQGYSAYNRLVQAYRAYAAQYEYYYRASASQYSAEGQAEAQGNVDTAARAASVQTDTAQEWFAALQAKYARHGLGAPSQHSRPATRGEMSTGRVGDIGIADNKRAVTETYPYPGREQPADRSIGEATEP